MPPIKVGFPPTDVYMEPLPYPTDSSCEPGPDAAREGEVKFSNSPRYSVFLLVPSPPQRAFSLTLGL